LSDAEAGRRNVALALSAVIVALLIVGSAHIMRTGF